MDITNISLPTIFDPEYSSVSSYQASWVTYEFVKHSKSLCRTFLENDISGFINIYKGCLETGSKLRKGMGINKYGENIDNDIIIDHYSKDHVDIVCSNGIYKNKELILQENFSKELYDEYYVRDYYELPLKRVLIRLLGYSCLLVNRNEKSFVVIPLYDMGYLVCDPEKKEVHVLNKEELMNYIIFTEHSYLYVSLLHAISTYYPLEM